MGRLLRYRRGAGAGKDSQDPETGNLTDHGAARGPATWRGTFEVAARAWLDTA